MTELEQAYETVTDAQKSRIMAGEAIAKVAIADLTEVLKEFPAPANDPVLSALNRLLFSISSFKSYELASLKTAYGMNQQEAAPTV